MDLLEEVESIPTFQPRLESESEDEGDFNIDVDAISKTLGADQSILSRVRARLQKNEPENEADTQEISQPDQPLESFSFGASILGIGSETQPISQPKAKETQRLPQLAIDESEFQQTQKIQRLPQLPIDESEFDQRIELSTQTNDAQVQDTQQIIIDTHELANNNDPGEINEAQPPLSKEERILKIAKLAEEKRKQRMLQEKQLEADISHTTLTDEENDLNEHNDSVVSSHTKDIVSNKELQQAEEFINIQKRNIDLRPKFQKKVTFTKDKLLSAFSDDDLGLDQNPKSSPTTSPLKTTHNSSEEDDSFNVQSLKHLQPDPQPHPRNPFELYAESLKRNLSPTKKKITLDDSESELEFTNSSPLKQTDLRSTLSVPQLTKSQKLLIKQKFSKKKYGDKAHAPPQHVDGNNNGWKKFLTGLRQANITQLKAHQLANPNHEIIEELKQDDEAMGTLLEREMERVRNIRKKEKLREQAKAALISDALNKSENEEYQVSESEEVPDSDFESGSEMEESGSDNEENEVPSDEEVVKHKRRSKKLVLDEDEEEEEEGEDEEVLRKRHDDSYMFEGPVEEPQALHEMITTADGDSAKSLSQKDPINYETKQAIQSNKPELFSNLQPRTSNQDSLPTQDSVEGNSIIIEGQLPEFQESFVQESEAASTQADTTTQADATLMDTQPINEEITPGNVKRGLEEMRKSASILEDIIENQEKEEEEEDHEVTKQRIKEYEDKIRKRELKLRKKRKEFERKGLKNIVEGEAEESEDEWHGLGGDDGELSDYQANSEDEKMIDNNFNIDLNDEDVRNKFMEQYQIKDKQELEKLLDDVKNHRLNKKVQGNGFDIELSDEEDEILAAYRRQKLAEQKERLKQNKALNALSKNEKMKAFYASIQENNSVITLDDDSEDEESKEASPKSESQKEKEEVGEEEDEEEKIPHKKIIRVEEAFVQRQLSFLTSGNDDDYDNLQRISAIQHGVSDDELEDIQTLKTRSLSNLTSGKEESRKRVLEEPEELTDADEDIEFMPAFKKPSIIKSFKSFQEKQGTKFKDGKQHFSGVTISKQYKVASGSKASITYMSKNRTSVQQVKTTKEKRLERSLAMSKEHGKTLFTNEGFDN